MTTATPVSARTLGAVLTAVGSAGCLLIAVRWHAPENFFEFNSMSIPWRFLWSVALLAAVLFAVTAYLVDGLLAALAWFGAALLALSAVGLLEAFWFAFQVLQGTGATQVLTYARGYAVTFAVALVLTWAATALGRRAARRAQPPAPVATRDPEPDSEPDPEADPTV